MCARDCVHCGATGNLSQVRGPLLNSDRVNTKKVRREGQTAALAEDNNCSRLKIHSEPKTAAGELLVTTAL